MKSMLSPHSRRRARLFSIVLVCLVALGAAPVSAGEGDLSSDNPLLAEWHTPFGVPPFDRFEEPQYLPAFRAAMVAQVAEVDAIIADGDTPSFANTIEALERSGKALSRVSNVFFAINSANSNDEIREIARTVSPELAAHGDAIALNGDLFQKVRAVYEQRASLGLNAEQSKLLEETHKRFVRSGAALPEASQERLRVINQELAELTENFGQNLLKETNAFELYITDRADLGELPESLVEAAAEEAKRRGHESGWTITLQRPSCNPFMQYSPNREMRRKVFEGYAMRANNGNDADNNELLKRIVDLRIESAKLMGYQTHAHFVLSDAMAETPDRVYALLDKVWKPTTRVAKAERDALQEMLRADGIDDQLRGWDWRYYTERLRQARYDLDEDMTRPYFEVSAVRDGVFMVCKELFGLEFIELADVPRWHPDQQVFEVKEADGSHLGVVYLDFFARESKGGGAWMNDLRPQSRLDGPVDPIVTTNFNYPPPTESGPSLLSFDEASTLFHEFGHAVHGLLSDVTYASLSGTNVPRDFVEFPSQVMENWMGEPEVLRMFARHYETGEPIPDELIEKIQATSKFDQGFATAEYMAACYLDMAWHTLRNPQDVDPREFEAKEMARIGLIDEIIPRYRNTYFAHIYSGGYSAGYYSYLWSEVLDADAFEAFKDTNLFDAATAVRYRRLLASGGTAPGMDLYRAFRGRDPKIEPLLERRGLTD
jgi:peptidyl-dipeptidase Dcp